MRVDLREDVVTETGDPRYLIFFRHSLKVSLYGRTDPESTF